MNITIKFSTCKLVLAPRSIFATQYWLFGLNLPPPPPPAKKKPTKIAVQKREFEYCHQIQYIWITLDAN